MGAQRVWQSSGMTAANRMGGICCDLAVDAPSTDSFLRFTNIVTSVTFFFLQWHSCNVASQFPYERWAHDQDNPGSMCARFTWDVPVRDYREDSGQATTEAELWRYSFRRLRWDATLGDYAGMLQPEAAVGNHSRSCRFRKLGSMYPERYNGKLRWEATVGGQERLHCRL